ncbi:MAG TPA: hypothetical protein VFV41_01595 [Streptosporangiaceae bacterium]|nr:hypothetical protein [Streptosporangiaceae bacterium]
MRDSLELGSLDFLRRVEVLSERTGERIDEDDYPQLATIGKAIGFLTARSSDLSRGRGVHDSPGG